MRPSSEFDEASNAAAQAHATRGPSAAGIIEAAGAREVPGLRIVGLFKPRLLLPGGWGDCHPDHEFDLRGVHGVDLRWWWRRLEVLALGEAGQ